MIPAMHDGRCPGCDEPIHEGDSIGLIDGEWCCALCVEQEGEDA